MASQDQVKVKVGGIPGLAALASLKLGVIFVFVVEDFRIPGLAALASLKPPGSGCVESRNRHGFRGLLPWPH